MEKVGSFHLWSSLISGLKLLKCGLRRFIGDGTQVRTFKDPWLSRSRSFQPIFKMINDDCRQGVRQKKVGADTDRDGVYNVKSGYSLAWSLQVEEGVADSSKLAWWNRVWNLNLPPKVKVFVWRMFHLALLVATQLISWKVQVPLCCSRCGEEAEIAEHALFFCSGLILVWHRLRVWLVLRCCAYGLMQEILLSLFDRLSCEAFELMMTTL